MLKNSLVQLLAKRIGLGIFCTLMVSLLIFIGVELLPGDLADILLGKDATPETLAAFRAELGLDQPSYVRYFNWLAGFVHGDLGKSLASNIPITQLISDRLGNTFFLAILSALVAVPLSLALGVLSALYRNSFFDKAISVFTLGAISFPEFFIAYILIAVFAIGLGWFSPISNISGDAPLMHRIYVSVLPAITLTFVITGHMMRMVRAAIITLLSMPYIEMANLKGLKRIRIIVAHALPNALSPIINVVILNLAYLVVGVVIVEVVFVYPGMGQLMVDSVAKRDIPVVQACGMIFAVTYIMLNLLADVLSIISNPRLMHPRR